MGLTLSLGRDSNGDQYEYPSAYAHISSFNYVKGSQSYKVNFDIFRDAQAKSLGAAELMSYCIEVSFPCQEGGDPRPFFYEQAKLDPFFAMATNS